MISREEKKGLIGSIKHKELAELTEALATITDQLQDMTETPDSLTTSAAA